MPESGTHQLRSVANRKFLCKKLRLYRSVDMTAKMWNRILGVLVVLSSLSHCAWSTAQEGDLLIYKGKTYSLLANPLTEFLRNNPGKLPKSEIISTSRWRGYVATWEVKDDVLWLKDITILVSKSKQLDTEERSVMEEMFGSSKAVRADWFSGNLIVPQGKLVDYVHMGYGSTFQRYLIFRVEKGAVNAIHEYDRERFKAFSNRQFDEFKKTDKYKAALAEHLKDKDAGSKKEIEKFLRQFYSVEYLSTLYQ